MRLLHLEDDAIADPMAGTFEQPDPAPRSDAAHADDLAGHVDRAESVEQDTSLVGQALAVALDQRHDVVEVVTGVVQVGDERRIVGEAEMTIDVTGVSGHRPQVVLALRPLHVASHPGPVSAGEVLDHVTDRDPVVPEVEGPFRGIARHALAVLASGGPHHSSALRAGEATLAGDDLQAGAQAFDVPLPWTRQRLVEVVDVEHEVPLGGGELPEVAHVGVAARLHGQSGGGGRREIHGHDGGATPEEGEWRLGHAGVPDGHQVGNP